MERSISTLKFEYGSHAVPETGGSSRCDICGKEFETPLFAVVSSGYLTAEYYACPRCLSKVNVVEPRKKTVEVEEAEADVDEEEVEEPAEMEVKTEAEEKAEEIKPEDTVACEHQVGYLKRRPKNTPIPEECLTCNKMIECMSY